MAAITTGALIAGGSAIAADRRARKSAKQAAAAAIPRDFALSGPFGSAQFTPEGLNVQGGIGAELADPFKNLTGALLSAAGTQPLQGFTGLSPDEAFAELRNRGGIQPGFQALGEGFQGAAQGALAGFQGFDPDAFAQEQFQRLQSLASEGEATAAESTANRLFARGRLGGADTLTGNVFGELEQAQERARTERALQAIGLSQQEQASRLGLATGLAGAGTQQFLGGAQFAAADISNLLSAIQGAGATSGVQAGIQGSLLQNALAAFGGLQGTTQGSLGAAQLALAGSGAVTEANLAGAQIGAQQSAATANLLGTLGGNIGSALIQRRG